MKIIIVGGGIGGLVAALELQRAGHECTVYEQASEIKELGVGINVLPHAVAVLSRLDLVSQLDSAAVRTKLICANRLGQEIWRERRGVFAGHNVPQFSIHRGRLQRVLLNSLVSRHGPIVKTGHQLTAILKPTD